MIKSRILLIICFLEPSPDFNARVVCFLGDHPLLAKYGIAPLLYSPLQRSREKA